MDLQGGIVKFKSHKEIVAERKRKKEELEMKQRLLKNRSTELIKEMKRVERLTKETRYDFEMKEKQYLDLLNSIRTILHPNN